MKHIIISIALLLAATSSAHASAASDAVKNACLDNPQHPYCQELAAKKAARKARQDARWAAILADIKSGAPAERRTPAQGVAK
jgi:hypothetical protein